VILPESMSWVGPGGARACGRAAHVLSVLMIPGLSHTENVQLAHQKAHG
jgi:hypothetical protein